MGSVLDTVLFFTASPSMCPRHIEGLVDNFILTANRVFNRLYTVDFTCSIVNAVFCTVSTVVVNNSVLTKK